MPPADDSEPTLDVTVAGAPPARQASGGGAWPATGTPRPRSRCGCGRAPSTSSPGRSTCSRPARRSGGWSRATSRCRCCCGGRPGTGKTTIASIVSRQTNRHFVEVSAVAAGVKEVRAAIDAARSRLSATGEETVLFVDEVHRFTKAQQDALLPGVENRWVTLVAATTENPFFSVISPLLSRSLLLTLEPLTDEDVGGVVDAALTDERGLGGAVALADDARDHLVRLAGGDARRALTYLEAAAGAAQAAGAGQGRPGHRRDRGRPGGGALRPAGRPALRRHQRVHQVDPRLRRRRRAPLPGPDDRGGRGPALHRPAAGDPGQRGHRPGRPDRADHRGGRGAGGAADRHAGGPAQPRAGDDRARGRPQVERRDHRDRGGERRRPPRAGRPGAAAPARRPLPGREEARPRHVATPTRTTRRTASPSSSTPPTRCSTPSTTAPRPTARRRRSRSAGSASGASCGDDRVDRVWDGRSGQSCACSSR